MPSSGNFLLYTTLNGAVKVDVYFQGESVWHTQKALAELFGVQVRGIAKHLKKIFESGELSREATVSGMEMVRSEGERKVGFYNLDTIITGKQKGGKVA